jgi:MFS superfamily sulfate permease-like transporter
VLGIAVSCFVLIIAQSAATSRSFALKHDQRVDVNRDIVGLSAANLAAGLTGTFVVNGSPTKTQILDEQKGRTQVANMTMSLVVLVVVLFLTGLLTDMPEAVLAAIVFLIGFGLIDVRGLRRILAARPSEFVIASITAVVVFSVGVEQGIVLAIVLSILEIVRRAYAPKGYVVVLDDHGDVTYVGAEPGNESLPGLLVFRFDARLFFANASRFSDAVLGLVAAAPTPVRWLVLDCSSLGDVDYSASVTLAGLISSLHREGRVFAVAAIDPELLGTLTKYGTLADFDNTHIYSTVEDAVQAFRAAPASAEHAG